MQTNRSLTRMVVSVSQLLLFGTLLFSGLLYHAVIQNGNMTSTRRPNFIIILADDIGWGDLGANQQERQKLSNTPNLDLMAQEGMRLTDFHSPASTCSPSRAALLTGRHGLRNGVTHNFAVGSVGGLPLSETTLAEILHQNGYYTAMIVQIQHYRVSKAGHSSCYSKVALPLFENETIVEQPLDLWRLTQRYTSTALDVILKARKQAQPFLLYMALAHMHVPLSPHFHVPLPSAPHPSEGAVYAASLRDMDELVGAIKNASDASEKDNTLIWFTGDNGPWDQKCLYSGSVGPFQGKWQTSRGGGSAKRTTWEGGHRVPTVAYWPGRVPANSTSSALLSGLDIFPTLLSLAGVKPLPDRRYDGMDATDVLLHGTETGHKFLFHPNSGAAGKYGDLQTVRMGRHKAFYITGGAEACSGSTGKEELHDPPLIFDLSQDKAEETTLDPTTEEYREAEERGRRAREVLLYDIATDPLLSTADYTTDQSAAPCCDRRHASCRCSSG
ncbi:arylsulfatase G isoform X5 [Esox lucius]|uniref:arylsulfatase G isoform X5 n=1 Tax=Esox lucius TaxID=8010 RepID=UPI00147779A7|nr:arylsulfatase G isoform X5 [Esox lucius]